MAQITDVGLLPQVSFPEYTPDMVMPLNLDPYLKMDQLAEQKRQHATGLIDKQLEVLGGVTAYFDRDKQTLNDITADLNTMADDFATGNYTMAEMEKTMRDKRFELQQSGVIDDIVSRTSSATSSLEELKKMNEEHLDPYGYNAQNVFRQIEAFEYGETDSFAAPKLMRHRDVTETFQSLAKSLEDRSYLDGLETRMGVNGKELYTNTDAFGVGPDRLTEALPDQDIAYLQWEYQNTLKYNPQDLMLQDPETGEPMVDEEGNYVYQPFGGFITQKAMPFITMMQEEEDKGKGTGAGGSNMSLIGQETRGTFDLEFDILPTSYSEITNGIGELQEQINAKKAIVERIDADYDGLEARKLQLQDIIRNAEDPENEDIQNATQGILEIEERQAQLVKDPNYLEAKKNIDGNQFMLNRLQAQKEAVDILMQEYFPDLDYQKALLEYERQYRQIIERYEEEVQNATIPQEVSKAETTKHKAIGKIDKTLKKVKDQYDKTVQKHIRNTLRQRDLLMFNNVEVVNQISKNKTDVQPLSEHLSKFFFDNSQQVHLGEMYVLTSANISTRDKDGEVTTDNKGRGYKLDGTRDELPIGFQNKEDLKVVGVLPEEIPGKGIGYIVEQFAEDEDDRRHAAGSFIYFPGENSDFNTYVSELFLKHAKSDGSNSNLTRLGQFMTDRSIDQQLANLFYYPGKAEGVSVPVIGSLNEEGNPSFTAQVSRTESDSGEHFYNITIDVDGEVFSVNDSFTSVRDVEVFLERLDSSTLESHTNFSSKDLKVDNNQDFREEDEPEEVDPMDTPPPAGSMGIMSVSSESAQMQALSMGTLPVNLDQEALANSIMENLNLSKEDAEEKAEEMMADLELSTSAEQTEEARIQEILDDEYTPAIVSENAHHYKPSYFSNDMLKEVVKTIESSGNYRAVNKGYRNSKGKTKYSDAVGAYQFLWSIHGPNITSFLEENGVDFSSYNRANNPEAWTNINSNPKLANLSREEKQKVAAFLDSPKLQEDFMNRFIERNYVKNIPNLLELNKNFADKHNGRIYTVPEMVAGMHQSGVKGFSDFIKAGSSSSNTRTNELNTILDRVRTTFDYTKADEKPFSNPISSNIEEHASTVEIMADEGLLSTTEVKDVEVLKKIDNLFNGRIYEFLTGDESLSDPAKLATKAAKEDKIGHSFFKTEGLKDEEVVANIVDNMYSTLEEKKSSLSKSVGFMDFADIKDIVESMVNLAKLQEDKKVYPLAQLAAKEFLTDYFNDVIELNEFEVGNSSNEDLKEVNLHKSKFATSDFLETIRNYKPKGKKKLEELAYRLEGSDYGVTNMNCSGMVQCVANLYDKTFEIPDKDALAWGTKANSDDFVERNWTLSAKQAYYSGAYRNRRGTFEDIDESSLETGTIFFTERPESGNRTIYHTGFIYRDPTTDIPYIVETTSDKVKTKDHPEGKSGFVIVPWKDRAPKYSWNKKKKKGEAVFYTTHINQLPNKKEKED